jgi:hypothetical protein
MNDYIGKICPFCKTEIKENDDIVICSSCDMPHHKDCWIENQGCTTFGCLGTIKAVDNGTNTVTAKEIDFEESGSFVFCTKCGTKSSGEFAFCSKCGNPLKKEASHPVYEQANPANTNPYAYTQQTNAAQSYSTPYQQNSYTQQTYNSQSNNYQQNNYYNPNTTYAQQNAYTPNAAIDPDVVALVGKNQQYYINKFQEMKGQNKTIAWHWMAFWFPGYWFMYRKMYAFGAIALGIMFLIGQINIGLITALSIGGYVATGLFSNYIYMNWLEKKAAQMKGMPEPFKTQFIQNNGGVNSTALALTIVVMVVLSIITSFI